MNISLNWLSQYINLADQSLQQIDDLLTFAGIEIEGIHPKGVTSDRIVVAQILAAEQHPNADRLKVTQVDAGEGSPRQIVCGARNYKVGDKVPCALPGAALPGGFTIGETKMRGVESKGMLCAASEIGLTDKEDGLLLLEGDPAVGSLLKDLYESDVLLEVEVTPNRPDLLSHRGLARELAALLKTTTTAEEIPLPENQCGAALVVNDIPQGCPFYTLTKISNVSVHESPPWLQDRLKSIGLRPINNVVDITNFVLHEMGQPLHAFDAAKTGERFHLRAAAAGETFNALNDSIYQLNEGDLLISDETGALLALAGVMGGAESSVTETTTEIWLEAAYFDSSAVRATSRAHILSSDSSYRFERGIDPQGVLPAAARATQLLIEIAGGTVSEPTFVIGDPPQTTGTVELDPIALDQLMGGNITLTDAEEILSRLGLFADGENRWYVPSYRPDLQRHIDLVEEIARVHGLANVAPRHRSTIVPASDVDAATDIDMAMRRSLAALGLYESQTMKLIAENQLGDALTLRPLQAGDLIKVSMPLSEDHAIMRPSLLPGLVATAARNIRQGVKSLRFFEMGRVFRHNGGGKSRDHETDSLGLLLSGPLAPDSWTGSPALAAMYDLRAILHSLLPGRDWQFTPRPRDGFALACDILIGDINVGIAARLLPARERSIDCAFPVYVCEIDLAKLRKFHGRRSPVEELPPFPGSSRDAAMEMPLAVSAAQVDAAIRKIKEPLLMESACFDVFTDPSGQKIAADRKSMAYRFLYRSPERTLKAEEVDAAHRGVLDHLGKQLGVIFR